MSFARRMRRRALRPGGSAVSGAPRCWCGKRGVALVEGQWRCDSAKHGVPKLVTTYRSDR